MQLAGGSIGLVRGDVHADDDDEESDEGEVDDGVDEDGHGAGVHVAELHEVVLPGELQQQPRGQQHEQHHRDHHRPPVRHPPSPSSFLFSDSGDHVPSPASRLLEAEGGKQWSREQDQGQQAFLLADAALRGEMEGREETLASCLRLGFACCAAAPGKRPAMRDVLQAIDRIPSPSSNSSSAQ